MTSDRRLKISLSLAALTVHLTIGSAFAQVLNQVDTKMRACTEANDRPSKVLLCADLVDDVTIAREERLKALYHHALGLLTAADPLSVNKDLEMIKAIDPESAYIRLLEKERASRDLAVKLLEPCDPPRICR